MSSNVIPIISVPSPASAAPGSTITITVTMNEATTDVQPVAISAGDPALFSSIPSSVDLQIGEHVLSFQVTLAPTASGSSTISATCNGNTKTCSVAAVAI